MESELVGRLLAGMHGNNSDRGQSQSSLAGGHNSGTQGSFTNNEGGSHNFGDVNFNSGANSGNRNIYGYDNHGGGLIQNSGTTHGNGNGSIVFGGFDSSTKLN